MMEEVLHIKNVSKVYEGKVPHTALKNINLHVDKGEFVAIMYYLAAGNLRF